MKKPLMMSACNLVFWILVAFASLTSAQTVGQLIPHKVKLASVDYLGKRAVKITEDGQVANGEAYAIVKDAVFHNGAIEVELAGRPADATSGSRGFIGIAFRLQNGQFEYIYLRPTNGRADDQVRRNHSTQYSAYPNFSFADARQQAPEKYESYVDLEPGVWTRYRITVEGTKARLYVHGTSQPCLIVNDLKLGDSSGGVALWIGPGTEGYFTGLEIKTAVALAGISNLVSLYGDFDPRTRYDLNARERMFQMPIVESGQTRMGVPPWKDLERYVRNSPVFSSIASKRW